MIEREILPNGLHWFGGKGYAFYPVEIKSQYDAAYFNNYVSRENTTIGRALTKARINLVEKHVGNDLVVDIGIGSGHFIRERGPARTKGYDVNEVAIRWLLENDLWHDPYFKGQMNMTCWDSLEHMRKPEHFLEGIGNMIFVSIPIFRDLRHILASKHFKTDEHFWYFTHDGFIRWMHNLNFLLMESNRMESDIGREDIGSFVFKKSTPGL
jgi:hypothetical protein